MGSSKPKANKGLMLALKLVIIGTSVMFISSRIAGSSPPPPRTDLLRAMTLEEQETLSERCMEMLEEIQALLMENDLAGIRTYRCPLHNLPYVVDVDGDTITVSDPDPMLHGFEAMRVSNRNPDIILID